MTNTFRKDDYEFWAHETRTFWTTNSNITVSNNCQKPGRTNSVIWTQITEITEITLNFNQLVLHAQEYFFDNFKSAEKVVS